PSSSECPPQPSPASTTSADGTATAISGTASSTPSPAFHPTPTNNLQLTTCNLQLSTTSCTAPCRRRSGSPASAASLPRSHSEAPRPPVSHCPAPPGLRRRGSPS